MIFQGNLKSTLITNDDKSIESPRMFRSSRFLDDIARDGAHWNVSFIHQFISELNNMD